MADAGITTAISATLPATRPSHLTQHTKMPFQAVNSYKRKAEDETGMLNQSKRLCSLWTAADVRRPVPSASKATDNDTTASRTNRSRFTHSSAATPASRLSARFRARLEQTRKARTLAAAAAATAASTSEFAAEAPPTDGNTTHAENNSHEQSPLFRLPPELRLQVYEALLLPHAAGRRYTWSPQTATPCSFPASSPGGNPRGARASPVNLLLTSRRLFAEVAPLFYSQAELVFTSPDDAREFANRLRPEWADHARHAQLVFPTRTRALTRLAGEIVAELREKATEDDDENALPPPLPPTENEDEDDEDDDGRGDALTRALTGLLPVGARRLDMGQAARTRSWAVRRWEDERRGAEALRSLARALPGLRTLVVEQYWVGTGSGAEEVLCRLRGRGVVVSVLRD